MNKMFENFSRYELEEEYWQIREYLNNSFLIDDVMKRIEILLSKSSFENKDDAERIYYLLYPIVNLILSCGALPYRLEKNLANFSVKSLNINTFMAFKFFINKRFSPARVDYYISSNKRCLYYHKDLSSFENSFFSIGPLKFRLKNDAVNSQCYKFVLSHELLHISSYWTNSKKSTLSQPKIINGFSEVNVNSFIERTINNLICDFLNCTQYDKEKLPFNFIVAYTLLIKLSKNDFLRTFFMGDECEFNNLLDNTFHGNSHTIKSIIDNTANRQTIDNIITKYSLEDDKVIRKLIR